MITVYMANTSVTVLDDDVFLSRLNQEEVIRQIPLIIYLVVISVTGVFGNILTWFVYKTKYGPSNCRTFLLFLSSVDLFSCVLGIPFEILVLLKQYNFRNNAACKISVLLNSLPTLTSGFILLVIAIDRYRKICKPFEWQISLRYANAICALCAILGACFSWLSPVIYGVNKSKHLKYSNVTISECVETDYMQKHTVLPLLNNIFFAVLFVGTLVSVSVMYCFIGAGVRAHAKRRDKLGQPRQKSYALSNVSDASEMTIKSGLVALGHTHGVKPRSKDEASEALFCSEASETKSNENTTSGIETEPCDPVIRSINSVKNIDENNSNNRKSMVDRVMSLGRYSVNFISRTLSTSTTSSGNRINLNRISGDVQSRSAQHKAQKTTFIMFLISLAFILSYFPLLCILLIRSTTEDYVRNLSDSERTAYKFFLRSYYLNCMVNPVIYGLWDAKFRKATRRLFCWRKCRQ